MGAIRKGVGKLVAACDRPPLVVPFVHVGMEDVMPRGKVLPSVGKQVRHAPLTARHYSACCRIGSPDHLPPLPPTEGAGAGGRSDPSR